MNAMAEVVSVADQRGVLVGISDFPSYKAYAEKYFFGKTWLLEVGEDVAEREILGFPYGANHFKRLTLTSLMVAQNGFQSLVGQYNRHKSYDWEKSAHSPEHQTATTIYLAKAAQESFKIKNGLLEKYPIEDDLVPGVWGTTLTISGGKVNDWQDSDAMSIPRLRREAKARLAYTRVPISVPDPELVNYLAAIPFTNQDAEKIPTEEFYRDIFPAVRVLVNDVTRPLTVFAA